MRRSTVLLVVTIAFAVLYAAATIALGTPPKADDSGSKVVAWFAAHGGNVRTWLWLLTLGAPLFATYVAIIRALLPAPHRDVFLFGAIAFGAETAVQGWLVGALALHHNAQSPATSRLVLDIAGYWGPVLTGAVMTMLAPVALAILTGRVALPPWVGIVAAVAFVEQLVETLTVFGHSGFFAPGGPMNVDVGAGITAVALIALGITASRALSRSAPAPAQPAER